MNDLAYSIKIIRKPEQLTNIWSGGTTTQLYIYPEDADYSKRNFMWRISSAKVDAEESEFTNLPGIWRLIMVLEGEMTLEHKGHHSVHLKPYEQDSFSGEWTTHSRGRVRDFNLMMAEGCRGYLNVIFIKKGVYNEKLEWKLTEEFSKKAEAFYCSYGCVTVTINGKEGHILNKGDFLIVKRNIGDEDISMEFHSANNEAIIIRTSIFYK